jgi:hypothetical protein
MSAGVFSPRSSRAPGRRTHQRLYARYHAIQCLPWGILLCTTLGLASMGHVLMSIEATAMGCGLEQMNEGWGSSGLAAPDLSFGHAMEPYLKKSTTKSFSSMAAKSCDAGLCSLNSTGSPHFICSARLQYPCTARLHTRLLFILSNWRALLESAAAQQLQQLQAVRWHVLATSAALWGGAVLFLMAALLVLHARARHRHAAPPGPPIPPAISRAPHTSGQPSAAHLATQQGVPSWLPTVRTYATVLYHIAVLLTLLGQALALPATGLLPRISTYHISSAAGTHFAALPLILMILLLSPVSPADAA